MKSLENSGCVNLRIGCEATNEHMRNDIYLKDIPEEALRKSVKLCKENKISVVGYFLVGGPGERLEWLMESLEFSTYAGIEYPVFFLHKPLAGTGILKEAEKLGSYMNHGSLKKTGSYASGVNMKHKHLAKLQIKAFYLATHIAFDPRIVFSIVKRSPGMFFIRLAKYMYKALAAGNSPYYGFSFFVMYGYDHRTRPILIEKTRARGFFSEPLLKPCLF